ncbi:hypothetical protein MGSAQ_002780 [marine sediment metagenome]|uniref:Uncharacterized protein n=1 Tax=marine sediment metagenome TaxID=412755 RepID=A0A1B6NQU5_9ZZZZ
MSSMLKPSTRVLAFTLRSPAAEPSNVTSRLTAPLSSVTLAYGETYC